MNQEIINAPIHSSFARRGEIESCSLEWQSLDTTKPRLWPVTSPISGRQSRMCECDAPGRWLQSRSIRELESEPVSAAVVGQPSATGVRRTEEMRLAYGLLVHDPEAHQ
jgi:hypothetical protein